MFSRFVPTAAFVAMGVRAALASTYALMIPLSIPIYVELDALDGLGHCTHRLEVNPP